MKDKEYTYEFFSPYKALFYDYVQFKRDMGHKFERTSIFQLRMFDLFLVRKATGTGPVLLGKELITEFLALRENESLKSQYMRMDFIHNLAVYLNQAGTECYIFPKNQFVKVHSEFTPYIFNHQEIKRLFDYVDHLKPSGRYPLFHMIYPMLLRLLYGCGLRINEALRLKLPDVDLKTGSILVIKSKNGSDRMVVMSESLREYALYYVNVLGFKDGYTGYLLPAPDGGHYNSTAAYVTLKKHMTAVGIERSNGTAPRVHDLRHTFAVHALDQSISNGYDIHAFLPILCAYLGHSNIRSTEQYLRLTESSFSKLTVPMETLFASLFEEVEYEES